MCATEPSRLAHVARGARQALRRWPLAGLIVALAAVAQQPSREQEQIRRLRQQVQQLQADLASAQQSAQAARAEADKRAGAAQAEASRARRSAGTSAARVQELEQRLQAVSTERDGLQTQLTASQAEVERLRPALAQARAQSGADTLRVQRRETELEGLQQRFARQNAALDLCSRHNQSLRSVSLDLLGRWQRMDWRDALASKEPFVQTERVRIENLVQGYEEQIDRASLAPAQRP